MQISNIKIVVTLLLSCLISLFVGSYLGSKSIQQQYKKIEAFNTFAKYEISRDIASSLKKGDYKLAKCQADLEASDGFDYVKKCMDDKQCAIYISADAQKQTPEIIAKKFLNFDYLERKNNERHCN